MNRAYAMAAYAAIVAAATIECRDEKGATASGNLAGAELLAARKQEYKDLLAKAKKENRALTDEETTRADQLHAEIDGLEKTERDRQDAVAAAQAKRDEQHRSLAAAAAGAEVDPPKQTANEFYRSVAKGDQVIGNEEVTADVVRAYESMSPIYAAHKNIQDRSTGNTFYFTKVVADTATGEQKAEGASGSTDTTTTLESVGVEFKKYSSQKVLITSEMLEDSAADVSAEISAVGMAKSVMKFTADAVTALMSADAAPAESTGTAWTIGDMVNMFFAMPPRHRNNLSWVCNGTTAAALVNLLGTEAGPRLAAIGFTAESIVADDLMPADRLVLTNITLALAIGRKVPIRVFSQDVPSGREYEVQPRLAAALRDGTAVVIRKRKTA